MGWKQIPGTKGWEVNTETTPEGRWVFRFAEDGIVSDTPALYYKLFDRVNDFFKADISKDDPRVRREDRTITFRIVAGQDDFRLFCTPITGHTFSLIKTYWLRDKWAESEEQKLLDKCLDELHDLGELTLETSAELGEYEELLEKTQRVFMQNRQGRLGDDIILAHRYFMLNMFGGMIFASQNDLKSIQVALQIKPTGRYDLATFRAVKRLQVYHKIQNADGLWKDWMNTLIDENDDKSNLGIYISELDITIYPNREFPSKHLIDNLAEIATVIIGEQNLDKYRKHNANIKFLRIGLYQGQRVYLIRDAKFMEDVGWKIRVAKMIALDQAENTNAIKELGLELERRGLTPENVEQMAEDIYRVYDTIDWICFFSAATRKIGKEGIEAALRRILKKAPNESWEEARERVYKQLGKSKNVILREGTDWFKLTKETFENYPKSIKRPAGDFFIRSKHELELLRTTFKNKVRVKYKRRWLKLNPAKQWNNNWQVHHIKPLKFGGNNNFENLTILTREKHLEVNRFWNILMQKIGLGGTY